MSSCEKCWADAYLRMITNPSKSQAEHYYDLIKEREGNACSPKDQAGQYWDEEKQIDRREGK